MVTRFHSQNKDLHEVTYRRGIHQCATHDCPNGRVIGRASRFACCYNGVRTRVVRTAHISIRSTRRYRRHGNPLWTS